MGIDHDSWTKAASAGWRSTDTAILACLAVAGLAYYGQYYDCGFNVGDEGSTVLISARLLDGERPFTDVVLGYGLLWFYPLVLLFKITGVSFIAARLYFLSLALITSLLAFLTVRRRTGRRGLAAAVALLTLAMPGTLHKSYIPLIVVANMLCLPSLSRRRTLAGKQVLGAGLVAAVSYHIRPDLGLIAALVLIATLGLHALSRGPSWPARIGRLGRLWMLGCAAALVPTLPLVIVAGSQGFLRPFLAVLYLPIQYLGETLAAVSANLLGIAWQAFLVPVAWAAPAQPAGTRVTAGAGKTLARVPWDAMWEGPRRDFAVLTYLPLLCLAAVAVWTLFLILRRRLEGRPAVADDTAGMLALTGLSGAAFPQFFLFRPDVAHLSQFMPGYFVLAGIVLGRWLLGARATSPGSGTTVVKRRSSLLARWTASGLLMLHLGFYSWFAFSRPATGSIAMARGRTERFSGASGVDVAVRPGGREYLTRVARVIKESSGEDDVVLCFPYCPGFNVMTRRKTFTRRLYFDDAMLILERDWQQRAILWIELERVPLIVIRDWAPNGTEISRFKNWATDVMAHIDAGYHLAERIGNTRFYRRAPAADTDSGQDSMHADGFPRPRGSGAEAGRRFSWRSPAQGLFSRRDAVHRTRIKATVEQTEAYLRTLDVGDFGRRGSELSTRHSYLEHVAGKLGRSAGELKSGRDYDFERLEEVERRLEGVDRDRALAAIFGQLTGGAGSSAEKHLALTEFLARAIRQRRLNPTYRADFLGGDIEHPSLLRVADPLVLLELGEGGNDQVAAVAVDLWRATGMEARSVQLGRHIVAELYYDGGWHYLDAVTFGSSGMVEDHGGAVPSLAELSRVPFAIDRQPSNVQPTPHQAMRGSPQYPSYQYFSDCPNCGAIYRYKTGTRRQQARDLHFGWCAKLTRRVEAKDIARPSLAPRFQPGAPRFVRVGIGAPEDGIATVEIYWQPARDEDGDLAGYRVYVSRQSRGWSYDPAATTKNIRPYLSHPAGWEPSMAGRVFELPESDAALVTTEIEEVSLALEAGGTYYVTVMPFDAHGEAVGRKIYRASQELKISF